MTVTGQLTLKPIEFKQPITTHQCMSFGNSYREVVAKYDNKNSYIMNDGSGVFVGFYCTDTYPVKREKN